MTRSGGREEFPESERDGRWACLLWAVAGQSRVPGQLTLRRLGAARLLTPHFVTCCLLPAPTPARRRPSLPHGPAEQRKSTTGASPLAVRQVSRSPLLPCENPVIDAPRSRRSKFLPELSSVFTPPLLHPAGPYSSPRCDKALSASRRRGGRRPGVFPGSCPPVVRPDTDAGAAAEGLGGCRAAVGLRTVRLSRLSQVLWAVRREEAQDSCGRSGSQRRQEGRSQQGVAAQRCGRRATWNWTLPTSWARLDVGVPQRCPVRAQWASPLILAPRRDPGEPGRAHRMHA